MLRFNHVVNVIWIRSAALYHLGYYEACIQDVDLAIKHRLVLYDASSIHRKHLELTD